MKRKIYQTLLDWKRKDHKNVFLLIDGARRVDKIELNEGMMVENIVAQMLAAAVLGLLAPAFGQAGAANLALAILGTFAGAGLISVLDRIVPHLHRHPAEF